jgi:hypothetical protein
MRLYLRGEIVDPKLVAEIICIRHKVILLKCFFRENRKSTNPRKCLLTRWLPRGLRLRLQAVNTKGNDLGSVEES